MTTLRSTPEFFKQLQRLIPDLPSNAIAIDIRMRPDEVVTITCVFNVATGDDEPATETKTFRLTEAE